MPLALEMRLPEKLAFDDQRTDDAAELAKVVVPDPGQALSREASLLDDQQPSLGERRIDAMHTS